VASEKLAVAQPALDEAEEALNTIKPSDITTVKTFAHPPHLIKRIMDCVLMLFQRKLEQVSKDPERNCVKPSWTNSLQFMTQQGFLQGLVEFPKDTINEETVELMQCYLEMDDYNINIARRVCGNVAGLLSWTRAMSYFFTVNKEVLPLKANLAIQEARLNSANDDLKKAEAQLADKQKELDEARAEYEEAMK